MFEKKIEFFAQEDYYNLKEDYPTPIKLNVPDWYKKLRHTHLKRTVKGCMPFLDTLTMGYVLSIPISMTITHNVKNEQGVPDTYIAVGDFYYEYIDTKKININTNHPQTHPCCQLEGSPFIEKNKNLPFYKILNPWIIKTPPGYSCLFVPPLNNSDDRFSIIPGIVDTDKVKSHINFPIIINGDKYPTIQTTLEKGTPYVQIIPFKRDDWKMSVNKTTTKKILENIWHWGLENINIYKNRIWSRKKCR
jgi:hypothetical protein